MNVRTVSPVDQASDRNITARDGRPFLPELSPGRPRDGRMVQRDPHLPPLVIEMKAKSLILLAMALGCGLVAMIGVQQVLSSNQQQGETDGVGVLVAKVEIQPGMELTDDVVAFETRSKAAIPEGAITAAEQYAKRATVTRLFPGEIVIQAKLGEPGVIGLAAQIPRGMQVVAVPVNMTSAISGLIQPGNKVDILCTYQLQKGGVVQRKTKRVLQNVEVFTVDRLRHAESGDAAKGAKPENVSFLVTPQQSNTLANASQRGQIHLALRSTTDNSDVKTDDVDDSTFEGLEADKVVQAEKNVEPEPAVEEPQDQQQLKQFLQATPPATSTAVEVPKEPAAQIAKHEMWSIHIYEGDTRRTETLELVTPRTGKDAEETHRSTSPKEQPSRTDSPEHPEPTASTQPSVLRQKSDKASPGGLNDLLKHLISNPATKPADSNQAPSPTAAQ